MSELRAPSAIGSPSVLAPGGFACIHGLAGDISADHDRPGDIRLHIPIASASGRPANNSDRGSIHVHDSRL